MDKINLSPEDPTIFAGCPRCNKRGIGRTVGDIYCKAFTLRRWKRNPVCENCATPLELIYEVQID